MEYLRFLFFSLHLLWKMILIALYLVHTYPNKEIFENL